MPPGGGDVYASAKPLWELSLFGCLLTLLGLVLALGLELRRIMHIVEEGKKREFIHDLSREFAPKRRGD